MRRTPSRALALAALLAVAAAAAFAANINVDRLELLTHGGMDSGTGLFSVDTRLAFGLSIEGGTKFGGLLRLEFLSGNIEEALSAWSSPLDPATATPAEIAERLNAAITPGFHVAAITARALFGLPLEATYFVGDLDSFCSGDDFVPLFGAAPFATELRGPMQYPEGIGGDPERFYDGIHAVRGTGARLAWVGGERFAGYLYAYQDADLGPGQWSTDLRALFDADKVKLELFAGASLYDGSAYGLYRAGLLFHYAPGAVGEFYAQVGVPRWDPAAALSAEDLFFLFEPRVNFGASALAMTVFYHPAWYRQRATDENGALDVGFDLRFGRLAESGSQGGLSSRISFRPEAAEPLTIDASPYYSVITSGVQWNFKLGLRAFPFPDVWYGVFMPFVGVKTSF